MSNSLVQAADSAALPRKNRAAEAARVTYALEHMCDSLEAGDRLPTHRSLMVQFAASERTVLRALDDLFKAGRIIRRQKAGTFVAERKPHDAMSTGASLDAPARTIVAITRPDNAFFSRNVELLMKLGQAMDYTIMFQPVGEDLKINLPPPRSPHAPCGYIVIGSGLVSLAETIMHSGHRVVALGEAKPGKSFDLSFTHVDNRQGGFIVAEHLIRLGHRRLAIVNVGEEFVTLPRWEGHQMAVAEAALEGLKIETVIVTREQVSTWSAGRGTAKAFFAAPGAPTAVSCWNDTSALDLLSILQRDQILVPGDLSIVGYDNLPVTATTIPSITSVDTNVTQQLRTAVMALTQRDPMRATTVLISPTLVERQSTCAIEAQT